MDEFLGRRRLRRRRTLTNLLRSVVDNMLRARAALLLISCADATDAHLRVSYFVTGILLGELSGLSAERTVRLESFAIGL